MTNATAPFAQGLPGVRMTIEVYPVTRDGIATPPRATVSVPYSFKSDSEALCTQLQPCSCWNCRAERAVTP